jgi:hypothetical protein
VISISRQQIVYQGRSQAELPLTDGTVFRLGPHGCYLRFGQLVEPGEDRQTLSFDARLMPVLALDVQKMQREVDAIVDGDYFQSLKDAAHLRRRQRMEAETNAPRAETRVDCYSHEDETRG